MNYFIIAGEASGDLHGANLAKSLLQTDSSSSIKAWGGNQLRNVNIQVTKDYKDLAIMGFVEVISHIPKILKNLKTATKEILEHETDAVILIDFSGFNLRLAKKLRKKGYSGKIFYYISPKLWVWNAKRVKVFKKHIDAVFCILPFEVDFYQNHGYNHAYYIGNPLMDELDQFTPNQNFISDHSLSQQPIIALLPGSRKNEIKHILPKMLEVVNAFPNYQFLIAGVPSIKELIDIELQNANLSIPIIYNQTYDVLINAELSLVTSGTATLETALLKTPQILCYKGNYVSYAIAKSLVNIDYIGLPNLILEKEMVKELVQEQLTKQNLVEEMNNLLFDQTIRQEFSYNQAKLAKKVGTAGASKKASEIMINLLKEK